MVSVTRTPSNKPKRRTSLFGLKKSASSNSETTPDMPAARVVQPMAAPVAGPSLPKTSSTVSTVSTVSAATSSRGHTRSYQQFPEQHQQNPQQFAFPRREPPQRRVTDEQPRRPQRDLDDTLPLQAFTSPRGPRDSFEDPNSAVPQFQGHAAPVPLLQGHSGVPMRPRSGSAPVHHDRTRSHFSIPDVMVTGCEEEGDEVHFEVKVPAEKRRTRLYTDRKQSTHESDIRKSISGKIRPLLRFDNDSPKLPSSWSVASPTTPTTPSSVASTEPNTPPKRTRKSSFPLLFGKGSKDNRVSSAADAAEATAASQRAQPPRSGSPYSQTGFDSSGSLPSSSSRDSLPSSTPSTPPADIPLASSATSSKQDLSRTGPAVNASSVPLPAMMPPLRPLTKKERKMREKEELALMKELQRVDKMVREHDAKATKARRKEEKKQRSDSGASVPDGSGNNARERLPKALKRMTIFSAAPVKPSPAAVTGSNLARRTSALRREAAAVGSGGVPPRARASRQMSDPLILSRSSEQAPPARPARPSTPPATKYNIPTIITTSPPRPQRPPPLYANAAEAEAARAASLDIGGVMPAKDSDESERPSFSPQEWADLPRFEGQPALTSLAGESAFGDYSFEALAYEASNSAAAGLDTGLERPASASSSWRHSVQRALAMADEHEDDDVVAQVAPLRKKTSVRRRPSSRKRGSDGFGNGTGSKRSSTSHEGTVGSDGLVRKRSHLLGKKEMLAEEPSDPEWEEEQDAGGEAAAQGSALPASQSAQSASSSVGKTSWESSLDGQATPVVRTAQLGEETPTAGSRVTTPLPRREGSGSSDGSPLPSPSREAAAEGAEAPAPRVASPEAMERVTTKPSFSSRKHSRTPKPLNLQQQHPHQQQSMVSSMSFNVGEIVPGSPPTVDFPPLPLEVLRGRKGASRSRTDSTGTGRGSASGSGSGSEDLGASSVSSSSGSGYSSKVSSPTSMSSAYSIAGPPPLEKVGSGPAARPIAAAFMSGSAL